MIHHRCLRDTWKRCLAPSLALMVLILTAIACDLGSPGQVNQNQALQQTQMALSVQATVLAQQANQGANDALQSQQATQSALIAQATALALQMAQNPQPPPAQPVDQAGTQAAASLQSTALSLQATQLAFQAAQAVTPQPPAQVPTQPPVQPATQPAIAGGDFKEFMKNASILLYEDMSGAEGSGTYISFRYVKKTLDSMGLRYTDTGSAMGRLLTQMASGGPTGKGWDLVIIAAERKSVISGEYFTKLMDIINQGSSVILEVWYLNQVSQGTASAILGHCGVEYYKNFVARNLNEEVMFIVESDNPILHEPNPSISFSKVTDYWPYTNDFVIWDLGDFMRLTGQGDARILVGKNVSDRNNYGTLVSCMNGQLILQTFSSHQVAYDQMGLAWENYIYNALKTRFNRPR